MENLKLIFLLMTLPAMMAGQSVIKGKVTDSKTGEGLIGATIVLTDFTQGVTSDVDGSYTLSVSKNRGDTIGLKVSYTGYISKNITIIIDGPEVAHNIKLKTDVFQLQDIVVSANKKAQSSQQVPMSISTLKPEQLRNAGSHQFRDYASGISNLSFDTQGAGLYGRFDNGISIRGVAGRNTTAMYLDETPMPENIDPRLMDLEQVEVLKGPQGTLYGSRNMGGAIKLITNQPGVKEVEGMVDFAFGGVAEGSMDYSFEGVLNIPLGNKLAFRGAGFYDFESGVFDRMINDSANILNQDKLLELELPDASFSTIQTDGCPDCRTTNIYDIDNETSYGFQASLGFYPNKKIKIIPKVILQNQSGDGFDFAEGFVGNFKQTRISGVPEYFEDDWKHYSLFSSVKLNSGKLISTTSFLDRSILEVDDDGESFNRYFEIYDGGRDRDFFGANISKNVDATQFNQEIRFQSDLGGKLEFTTGVFYLKEYEDEKWLSENTGAGTYISLFIYEDPEFAEYVEENQIDFYDFGGIYEGQEIAFFGEAYYAITDKLKATLGLRYFNANYSMDTYETGFMVDGEYLTVSGEVNESGVNPKFNLTYQIDKNKLVYATVAKGYRLGDLNEIVPEVFCSDDLAELPEGTNPRTFESDFLWNYELGFKSTWANGRLTTNAAAFYNDWQNLQQTRTLGCGYSFVSNVGSAHTAGFEMDMRAKVGSDFNFGGGFGLLNAVIDESGPNLEAEKGDRINFTPNVTANANAEYLVEIPDVGTFFLYADVQHVGERFNTFSPENQEEAHLIFDPYSIFNARIGLKFSHHEFSFFVNNLTNTAANFGNIFSVAVDIPGRPRYATNRPRVIGFSARAYF